MDMLPGRLTVMDIISLQQMVDWAESELKRTTDKETRAFLRGSISSYSFAISLISVNLFSYKPSTPEEEEKLKIAMDIEEEE